MEVEAWEGSMFANYQSDICRIKDRMLIFVPSATLTSSSMLMRILEILFSCKVNFKIKLFHIT